MDDEDIFICFMAIVLILFGVFCWGYNAGKSAVKAEAVTQNFAEYIPDEKGNSKWRWKIAPKQ